MTQEANPLVRLSGAGDAGRCLIFCAMRARPGVFPAER